MIRPNCFLLLFNHGECVANFIQLNEMKNVVESNIWCHYATMNWDDLYIKYQLLINKFVWKIDDKNVISKAASVYRLWSSSNICAH